MDEIKTKFLDLIHKQKSHVKIPAMGFSDYFIQNVTTDAHHGSSACSTTSATTADKGKDSVEISAEEEEDFQKSDQEVLESIEDVYFETDFDAGTYELNKILQTEIDCERIQESMTNLRQQQKAISKKVLQNILEQRGACNHEFTQINNTEKQLEEALWTCKKARSYLSFAKTNLTTTSLEILAAYRKRELVQELLKTLHAIKDMKSTDIELQKLLTDNNYSGAISLLLKCRNSASEYTQYKCVESLNNKLQETLILTEFQLDTVLNEMVLNFDMKKYGNLQDAYKMLNKSLIAMDQLHINFISAIHSSVNSVLRSYNDPATEEKQKLLFEQLCEHISIDRYIPCLISLCKTLWTVLASYYQIVTWHHHYKLFPQDLDESQDVYIEEKLKKGQSRIWNDMQSKICVYLSCTKLKLLKYEQFIQVLSIIQRLQKVGLEFCGESSDKLIETMQAQSEEFFNRYHLSCLEEICLFLDNESWTAIDSFSNILQLQEFRSVRHALRRQKSPPAERKVPIIITTDNNSPISNNCDELGSVHSQDAGSSIYGSCGYFLRFSEKSSPFDGGLDASMLEEDILSGIVDEASCYFSDSEDEKSMQSKSDEDNYDGNAQMVANNTSLNVLRCIGRYLQMCKLLHCISPKIVSSMFELIDFYGFAVHEIFCKDSPVQLDNFYVEKFISKLKYVEDDIIPKIKLWPLNFTSLTNNELANPETLFGLGHRIIAIESGFCMVKQFQLLNNYLKHLLPTSEHSILSQISDQIGWMSDISKPIYMCATSRLVDLQGILLAMGKVKWDINHVSVEHSKYVDAINRNIQTFAMRLEEISTTLSIPAEAIWNSMAHVCTHLLVEGFSNVKKCSAGGRALMQLDFTHFMSILELISGLKFHEHRSYVDAYVKAYYFPAELFEEWIQNQRNRKDYSSKQLSTLIQCVCAGDKRTKQKLLGLLGKENLNETQ